MRGDGAVALGAPGVAVAGVATADGGGVRFTDPAGAVDGLYVTIEGQEGAGWLVSFLQHDPPTEAGPGCAGGFVSTECPAASAPPVDVDGGAGDDVIGVEGRGVPSGPVSVRGGDGADSLSTFAVARCSTAARATTCCQPDERIALAAPPPPTPGSVIRGGPGTDTVAYATALDPIVVTLDGRADDGRSVAEADNVHPDVENVTLGDYGSRGDRERRRQRAQGGAAGDTPRPAGAGRDTLVGERRR